MARGGVTVKFLADFGKFIGEVAKGERSLADFGDALDSVAKDGDRAAEKLERSFSDTARAVNRATDDLDNVKGKAGAVGSEVGQEFSQNFGEAVRSGDPFGAILETGTSLGPAFGAAGVALAAAFGIGKAIADDITAQAERLREAGRTAWEALRDGMLDAAEQKVQLTAALGVDNLEDALDRIAELAADTGLEASDIAAYIATGVDPAGRVAAALERAAEAQERARASQDAARGNFTAEELAAANIADARERSLAALERGNDLLRLEREIEDGITNELRRQQEIRWATPGYGEAYANSAQGRYRP